MLPVACQNLNWENAASFWSGKYVPHIAIKKTKIFPKMALRYEGYV